MIRKDSTCKQIHIGDKVMGEGFIKFQDGFIIDRSPIVTVREHNGRIYCGQLSIKSFNRIFIVHTPKE